MLTIRVCIGVLISAVALWAQPPQAKPCERFQLSCSGKPLYLSPALSDAAILEPSQNAPDIPLSARLANSVDWSGTYGTEFRERKLDSRDDSAIRIEDDRQATTPPSSRPFVFRVFEDPGTSRLSHLIQSGPPFSVAPSQGGASRPQTASPANAYMTRRKIHKYVAYATLPLFVGVTVAGEKLIGESDDESGGWKSAHTALAATTGAFFGVETVTGVWNMWKTRKAPSKRRLIHGILMLAADVGLVATIVATPHDDDDDDDDDDSGIRRGGNGASAHRVIGYTSLGVATISYLYMLFTK